MSEWKCMLVAVLILLGFLMFADVANADHSADERIWQHQLMIGYWGGAGNGGPSVAVLTTANCKRTVAQLLKDGLTLNENRHHSMYYYQARDSKREFSCWTKQGELLWRRDAYAVPFYEGQNCLTDDGDGTIEICENNPVTIRAVFAESFRNDIVDKHEFDFVQPHWKDTGLNSN